MLREHCALPQKAYHDFVDFTNGADNVIGVHNCDADYVAVIEEIRKLVKPDNTPLGIPISSVIAIPSRGGKNRIVTKSHPGLIIRA